MSSRATRNRRIASYIGAGVIPGEGGDPKPMPGYVFLRWKQTDGSYVIMNWLNQDGSRSNLQEKVG